MQEQFRGGKKSCQNNLGRDSNIELLRLVCMLFILLHHFIVHGSEFVTAPSVWLTIMNSFLVIAVDCFVLISGYFGIKAKWKGFIHLYVLCAFYSVFISDIYGKEVLIKMDIM